MSQNVQLIDGRLIFSPYAQSILDRERALRESVAENKEKLDKIKEEIKEVLAGDKSATIKDESVTISYRPSYSYKKPDGDLMKQAGVFDRYSKDVNVPASVAIKFNDDTKQ